MQKLFILTLLLSAALFAACKQDSKTDETGKNNATTASPNLLGGHWIALDFCSRAKQYGSVLQAMNNAHKPYSYSLTFNPAIPDSVKCSNGMESWNVPVQYNADTLELVGAVQGKSVFLLYSQKNNDITMFNTTSGSAQMDRFIKSRAEVADGHGAFLVALNHHLFEGSFVPLKKGAAEDVRLMSNGIIRGWKEYDRYKVCTGGDCFLAGNDMDVITVLHHDRKDEEKYFGYRFSAQNDTLTFFNLVNKNPKEKGLYTIGSVAHRFLRKKG